MGHENFSQQLMFLQCVHSIPIDSSTISTWCPLQFRVYFKYSTYSHATKLKLWMTSVILFFEVSHQWPAGWKLIRPWRNIAKKLKLVVHERNLLQNIFFRHIRSWRNRICFSGESKSAISFCRIGPTLADLDVWTLRNLLCQEGAFNASTSEFIATDGKPRCRQNHGWWEPHTASMYGILLTYTYHKKEPNM